MSLKLLSKIDKRTKDAVYGWIRNKEKQLKLCNVPSMLKALCILYYRNDEIFHLISDNGIKLSENKKIIANICEFNAYNNSNFGINEILSESKAIYVWSLRIIKQSVQRQRNDGITIGISSKYAVNEDVMRWSEPFYAFWEGKKGSNNEWGNYSARYRDGDEVSMHLDLVKAEIKLIINRKDQGVAFTDVKQSTSIKYRLLVCLSGKNDCVEITDFTIN